MIHKLCIKIHYILIPSINQTHRDANVFVHNFNYTLNLELCHFLKNACKEGFKAFFTLDDYDSYRIVQQALRTINLHQLERRTV